MMKHDIGLCPYLNGMECVIRRDRYSEVEDRKLPSDRDLCPLSCKCPFADEHPGCRDWMEVFFHLGLFEDCYPEFSVIFCDDIVYILDGRTLMRRSYDSEGSVVFETVEAFIEDIISQRHEE